MKIQDLLRKDVMLLDLQATGKTAAIDEIGKVAFKATCEGW